jgi:hypothetical protein
LPSTLMLRFRSNRPNVFMSFSQFQDFAAANAAATSANLESSITSTFHIDPLCGDFLVESCVFEFITMLGLSDPKWEVFAHYLALSALRRNQLNELSFDEFRMRISKLNCFVHGSESDISH